MVRDYSARATARHGKKRARRNRALYQCAVTNDAQEAPESGLFVEDLRRGLVLAGGAVGAGLEISPAAFEARFGRLFWRPPGALDPIYFKLAAFCKTTAVSENSPANLGARNVLFHRAPQSLDARAETTVLGRKFRAAGASTGVAQVRSVVSDARAPLLTWTRECIVNGRRGWRLPTDTAPLDDREKIETHFDAARVTLPRERPDGARDAVQFLAGREIPSEQNSVLSPRDIFWLTRGLGNLAKVHYASRSGYIVWGLLTLLYGVHNHARALQHCWLAGLDVAKHTAPVYLTEKLREESTPAWAADEPAEFLSSTLTTRAVEDWPSARGVKLVTADLAVFNNVNKIGRAEYKKQNATKALANIDKDGRLHVGDYRLRLATF